MTYIIKEITVDNDEYVSSRISKMSIKGIGNALKKLTESAKEYVKDKYGSESAKNTDIIDIINLTQVCEPLVDAVLLYRLESDPHKIYAYRRLTQVKEQPGWTWGSTKVVCVSFKRVCIFELEEIADQESSVKEQVEEEDRQVKMTILPMNDLLVELKKNQSFLKKKFESERKVENIVQSSYYIPVYESESSEYSSESDESETDDSYDRSYESSEEC